MRRLTTTLLALALLLSLAAAVLAWDGHDDDQCPAVCPSVKTYQCADPCAPCPSLTCVPCLPCEPPSPITCVKKKCRRVTDPAGVTWEKCHYRGCRSSVAVP